MKGGGEDGLLSDGHGNTLINKVKISTGLSAAAAAAAGGVKLLAVSTTWLCL